MAEAAQQYPFDDLGDAPHERTVPHQDKAPWQQEGDRRRAREAKLKAAEGAFSRGIQGAKEKMSGMGAGLVRATERVGGEVMAAPDTVMIGVDAIKERVNKKLDRGDELFYQAKDRLEDDTRELVEGSISFLETMIGKGQGALLEKRGQANFTLAQGLTKAGEWLSSQADRMKSAGERRENISMRQEVNGDQLRQHAGEKRSNGSGLRRISRFLLGS